MTNYRIKFHKQAYKDFKEVKAIPALYKKTKILLKLLEEAPLRYPPNFEKLQGDLKGFYSRDINTQHRLIYKIDNKENVVKVVRIWWTHYE